MLVNMYGITETTVHVTWRPVTEADADTETRSLIGSPISDLRLYLLDAKRRPVPPGVVGELYVGGAGVSQGYHNRPKLTAERFVPDPLADHPDARMYQSGDLGRFLNNGDIEYLGRRDTQVKIHGFRIELGEIETALLEFRGLQHAVVTARKNGAGDSKLVAYFVPAPNNKPSGTELREFLEKKLPAHMVPHAFVKLDELPVTINGKLDRDSLPAPDLQAVARARDYVAPRTPQEELLATILAEVLRIEKVGVTDNLLPEVPPEA
jgi:acyl-coenzyme A synthetase/AMP-(fatty) acid ligase